MAIPPYREEADAEGKKRHADFAALKALTDDLSRENHALLMSVRKHVDVVQGLTEDNSSLVQKNNEASAALEKAQARVDRAEEALARLGSELGAVVEERDGLQGKLEEAERRAGALAAEVVDLEEEVLRARADRWADAGGEAAAKELSDSRKLLEALRGENALLKGRMGALQESQRALEVEATRREKRHAAELREAQRREWLTSKTGATTGGGALGARPPSHAPAPRTSLLDVREGEDIKAEIELDVKADAGEAEARGTGEAAGAEEPSSRGDGARGGVAPEEADGLAAVRETTSVQATSTSRGDVPAAASMGAATAVGLHQPEPEPRAGSLTPSEAPEASAAAAAGGGEEGAEGARAFRYLTEEHKALVAEITEMLLDTGEASLQLAARKPPAGAPAEIRPPGRVRRAARRFVDWVFLQDKMPD